MARLRRKRPNPRPSGREIEAAICMQEFRPAPVAVRIARHQQLPLDHPLVRSHPQFFRGLVRLDEEVKDNGE
jgi:hypothetical protein